MDPPSAYLRWRFFFCTNAYACVGATLSRACNRYTDSVLNRLLNLIVKATSVTPRYTPNHCLVVKKAVGGCTTCADVCPHDAITIDARRVTLDDIDCTGCGLCVQVCPSEALESRVGYQPGAPLRCSQVQGTAPAVHCLARLQASDLMRLASRQGKVTLARGDCTACPIGTAAVIEAVGALTRDAEDLARLRNRELQVEVLQSERLDLVDNPEALSRRDLLRGGWRNMQESAAEMLAPLDPGGADETLPAEMQRRYNLIERAKPAPEQEVPWVLPRVAEGCIMCPVCTNVCPTGAFKRVFDPVEEGSGATLLLSPERCNGCTACVTSCPVRVINLDEVVTWEELSSTPQTAYRREAGQGKAGSIARNTSPRP
jgi:ferredoxin